MNPASDSKARPERQPRDPDTKGERAAEAPDEAAVESPDEAAVESRDSTGGPTTLDWWLDDGPGSPIAADIKEPEKHL